MSEPTTRQFRALKRALMDAQMELKRLRVEAVGYHQRATRAEKDRDEWKARFDALLQRFYVEPPKTQGAAS